MKTYSTAYKAAKAYAATDPKLQREFDRNCNWFIEQAFRGGILKQSGTNWAIDLEGFNDPKGWYVVLGGDKVLEGPYKTKRQAVDYVGRRCGLSRPPRMTKLRAGQYGYIHEEKGLMAAYQYEVLNAEKAKEAGLI